MRIFTQATLLTAMTALPALADSPPPADAKALSELLQTVEQEAGFAYVDEIEWDDGLYEIEYYTDDGATKEVKIDPVSGETRP